MNSSKLPTPGVGLATAEAAIASAEDEAALGAYTFAVLPPDDPRRDAARPAYLAALVRHHAIRAEVAALVAAWRHEGVAALLFKGFHLSEFIYPAVGMRFHGDVDLVLAPADVRAARRVAESTGWVVDHDASECRSMRGHELLILHRPHGATRIDGQQFVAHCRSPFNRIQRRLTEAVLACSIETEWADTVVRVPQPVDALIILAVQRGWGDGWHLKAHDRLDVRHLALQLGSGWRDAALERAGQLRCERTLAQFLRRCEDGRGGPTSSRAPTLRRVAYNVATLPERPWMVRTPRVVRAPVLLVDLARAAPWLLRAWRAARKGGGVEETLRALEPAPAPAARSTVYARRRMVRGIRWGMRLLPRGAEGRCLLRSLAVYGAIRSQGWPAVFVSGVRREGGSVLGHAWVELEGQPLPELCESNRLSTYTVNVRHPATAASIE